MLDLRIQCRLRKDRLGPALDKRLKKILLFQQCQLDIVSIVVNPTKEITIPRGGVFEPALALVLVRDAAAFRSMAAASGEWVTQDGVDEPPVNLLFEWFSKRQARSVQIIDSVNFDVDT